MYNPPHFEESRSEELERIITEYPLGTLVYCSPDGLDAAHVPFMYNQEQGPKGKLIAHVARKNPIWQQVPWNYQVVHIHGRIRFIEDARFLRAAVASLTQIHETRAAEARPWRMSDGDKDYIDQQIASIVGIEIDVTRIVGKSKLSQNREPRDRNGAIAALRRRGESPTADAMSRAQPPS